MPIARVKASVDEPSKPRSEKTLIAARRAVSSSNSLGLACRQYGIMERFVNNILSRSGPTNGASSAFSTLPRINSRNVVQGGEADTPASFRTGATFQPNLADRRAHRQLPLRGKSCRSDRGAGEERLRSSMAEATVIRQVRDVPWSGGKEDGSGRCAVAQQRRTLRARPVHSEGDAPRLMRT